MQYNHAMSFQHDPKRSASLRFSCAARWILWSLWLLPAALAAQVQFQARCSSPELVQGNQFEVVFELKNAEGARFIPPDFHPFRVLSGPNLMQSATMLNGKTSTQLQWSYTLDAVQTGDFVIGPASVTVAGKILKTQSLHLQVTLPQSGKRQNLAPPGGAKADLFIAATVDREKAWTGQQINFQLNLYTLVSIEGADLIGLPDFKGFFAQEKKRFNTEIQYINLKGKKYAVKTIYEAALFPQEAGTLVIGPARIRAGVEQMGALGVFMGPRPVLLQTQPISLEVQALPTPLPTDFSGGVGTYSWEFEQDKDTLTTDEALTLRAQVRGDGDARRFAPPRLELPAGLEAFEPKQVEEETYENGERIIHRNNLEYVIMPKTPGEYAFIPVISVFDPERGSYQRVAASEQLRLVVLPGKNYAQQLQMTDSLSNLTPRRTQQPGIGQKAGYWLLALGALSLSAVLILLLWYLRRRRRFSRNAETQVVPPPSAQAQIKSAQFRLTEAGRLLHQGNPRAFYHALFQGWCQYLGVKLDLPTAQLSHKSVEDALQFRQAPQMLINQVQEVWQKCELALFSGQTDAVSMESLWRQAEECIQELERRLPGIPRQ